MREKIDEPVNRELYSRRMQIIEPVFSNITYCKGMDRFMLRTQKKVNIQWRNNFYIEKFDSLNMRYPLTVVYLTGSTGSGTLRNSGGSHSAPPLYPN
jgi:hypothetical protein